MDPSVRRILFISRIFLPETIFHLLWDYMFSFTVSSANLRQICPCIYSFHRRLLDVLYLSSRYFFVRWFFLIASLHYIYHLSCWFLFVGLMYFIYFLDIFASDDFHLLWEDRIRLEPSGDKIFWSSILPFLSEMVRRILFILRIFLREMIRVRARGLGLGPSRISFWDIPLVHVSTYSYTNSIMPH